MNNFDRIKAIIDSATPMCTLPDGEGVYLGEDKKIMKIVMDRLSNEECTQAEETHTFHCEPNHKIKGHPQPFYHKGRW